MQIVIASTNQGKIKEISALLQGFDIGSLSDYNNIPEPDEPYDSFMENAIHKAKYYAQIIQQPTLSEDAGLCIPALNNFPGVRTKDFAQECGSMREAFLELEQRLTNFTDKSAFYKCAAALYNPFTKSLITFEADEYGHLAFPAKGKHGFGFDPVFVPEGYNSTMAELGLDIKNKISHRAKAINGIINKID